MKMVNVTIVAAREISEKGKARKAYLEMQKMIKEAKGKKRKELEKEFEVIKETYYKFLRADSKAKRAAEKAAEKTYIEKKKLRKAKVSKEKKFDTAKLLVSFNLDDGGENEAYIRITDYVDMKDEVIKAYPDAGIKGLRYLSYLLRFGDKYKEEFDKTLKKVWDIADKKGLAIMGDVKDDSSFYSGASFNTKGLKKLEKYYERRGFEKMPGKFQYSGNQWIRLPKQS